MCDIVSKYISDWIIEALASVFLEIFQHNPGKECKEPLEILYRKMNCGIHRLKVIETLYENGVLSDEIKKEIEFDSYDEIREWYKANL